MIDTLCSLTQVGYSWGLPPVSLLGHSGEGTDMHVVVLGTSVVKALIDTSLSCLTAVTLGCWGTVVKALI